MQMNPGIILAGKDPTGMVLEAQKIPANALALDRQRMGNDMLRQQKMEADAGKLARMVLSSPDKPNAYKQALGVARQLGFDLSGFPAEYDDAVGERLGMISAITSMGKDARTKLESRIEMMRKAGATEDEIKKAIMIDAGLVPRATGGGTKAPSGFRMRADGNLEPIPGGPADPSYKAATGGGAKPPAGYRMRADGNLEFIPGGPADPKVKAAGRGPGMTVYDPTTGKPIMTTGGGLSKPTTTELEKRELDARDTLARLDRIEANIKDNPAMAEIGTFWSRFRASGLETLEKFGATLGEEDQKFLADVTRARRNILENVNFTIKAITGAAMTESEAKRIGATLPGVEDSPTAFRTKLEDSINATRMAVARYNYWRATGMKGSPTEITPLSDMPRLMRERAEELMRTMSPEEAEAQFAKEFGV